jgi:phosphoribosylamine---glycine ligase
MRILIVGNGGREHACCSSSGRTSRPRSSSSRAGTAGRPGWRHRSPSILPTCPALAVWAQRNAIDLALCGPESPLAAGIAEQFERQGVPLFGPSLGAANIEASKAYAKALMRRAGVPTAAFGTFTSITRRGFLHRAQRRAHRGEGLRPRRRQGRSRVLRARRRRWTRRAACWRALRSARPATQIVVESFLEGEELSLFALTDGVDVLTMLAAQDHKRIGEGDTGPNTGGMGAYAPVSLATEPLIEDVRRRILLPTLRELHADGHPFRGLLYAGLMLTADGPQVIEFNARFGDPETQVVLPLLRSSLLEPMRAIARGESIRDMRLEWHDGAAVTTVLAAEGYPGRIRTGDDVTIPADIEADGQVRVYHAGTTLRDGRLLTSGGRVLAVTGLGRDLASAAERSRTAAAAIRFAGRQYRRDIGWRELERATAPRH